MRIAIAALLKCAAESDDPIKSSFGGGVGGTWEVCTGRSVGELSKVSVLGALFISDSAVISWLNATREDVGDEFQLKFRNLLFSITS